VLDLIYDYYSCNGNGGNNGNVCQSINNKDGSRTQAFRYDQLNRLTAAWTPQAGTANSWANQYQYDPWGNLLQKVQIPNWPGEALGVTVNGNNQVTSWCYDAAGNVVGSSACPSFTNIYDGQNRLTSAQNNTGITTSYDYDANGQRVKKSNGSTNTLYWYGPGGEVLEETDLSGNLQNEYVFFGGKRIARYSATNGYSYYFADHLGSADVVTDASGNIKEESDYYPFGGERIVTDLGIDNRYKFTGKERDPETGCDYFGARYYCNPIGRFITPDSIAYSGLDDPQSLNLYSYVGGHPTSMIDPDGHCWRFFGWACNIYQRFANLADGEGFRTNKQVDSTPSRNDPRSQRSRQQEVNGGNSGQQPPSRAARWGAAYGQFHSRWDRWWAAHDCENSIGGCGVGPSLASLGVYTRPTRTLFRAVDRAEFEDIQKTGKFGPSPGGAESKYFYPTLEQAQKMGDRMYGEDYGIVVGTFPESAVQGPFPVATEGDVYTVPTENLHLAQPSVVEPLETPEIPE